ncbi:hypothetical protein PF005_g17783 [Phytophthora fragariae]|uniref:No apical meristem-associated C-terminal domain-containing protein n=1 Tax=Phytophthora fragariae TaxID=53985 RepID=A0A6A3EEY0_9STRA|nr:hypothetical protein PF003_g2896 [Phytophthora fragariae]KAE8932155.1 hypothetical protein PF009_g17805 [Phytophthora fragariae]KAE8996569.1 hypothetical protein PF011_g15848 [Phytophthora fragariae]KAE9096235.1 hypothetical protein PF007_g17072 [Phytophthora fragariae]KAE9096270.1 hypothetical protein PF010_g16405 [Phytophthora fragariae]
MSLTPTNRRKSKTAWSNDDDIRLCRAFVLATQDDDGTEHVKNMWTRVNTHYAALAAEEDPMAAPRAGGALQTHWSSFIRPEAAFFMSLLVKVEKEEHEGWTEKEVMVEATNRFEAIRQAEEIEALRAYREAKQQALLESVEPPPKPRTKATTFRYPHCIPALRTSKRFMRAAMSEKKPRVVRSPVQKRRRRQSKPSSDPEEASESSDASGDLHERVSPHGGESSPKRLKGSEASSAEASASSSSSSRSDESSDEGVPAPKGFVVSQGGQPPAARGNQHVARAGAQNGGFTSSAQMIKGHRSQQKANYRLKLLAELRGIVETISQLSNQLTAGGVPPMGVAAVDPTLAEEVQQDLRFFRDQKRRLKQELDVLYAAEHKG